MEIQRKRYEAINLKWKIAEIDEAQKQLDIMLKSGEPIDFNLFTEYVKFHFEYLDYETELPLFITYHLTEEEKVFLAKGLLQGTKHLFKSLLLIMETQLTEHQI